MFRLLAALLVVMFAFTACDDSEPAAEGEGTTEATEEAPAAEEEAPAAEEEAPAADGDEAAEEAEGDEAAKED